MLYISPDEFLKGMQETLKAKRAMHQKDLHLLLEGKNFKHSDAVEIENKICTLRMLIEALE